MRRWHLILLAIFVVSPLFGESLEELRRRVKIVNHQIDSLRRTESSYIARIDAMDKKMALLDRIVAQLGADIDRLQRRISVLSDSARMAQKKWKLHKGELLKLLREMYIMGAVDNWELVLLASDVNELAENLVYLESLSEARGKTMSTALAAYENYVGTVERLKSSRDSLKSVLAQKRASLDSLKSVRREYKSVLAKVRRDAKKREQLLARLEKSIEELESRLAGGAGGGKFAALKGKLPCPLGKKCSVLRGFGRVKDKKFGTVINNPGVDFRARRGQSVFAVSDGTVADVVWLPGYQNVVIVAHDGGYYTIYGNLGEVLVQKGQKVGRGTKIGRVGESSWLGDSPQLHFEIRRGKARENPLVWIK